MYKEHGAVRRTFVWLLFFLFLFPSCEQAPSTGLVHYLYLSHTRLPDTQPNRLLPAVEQIEYDSFDLLLLGGDLTYQSSADANQVEYLDSVFSLSNPQTLLSMGNHDYAIHPDLLLAKSRRSSFYAYHRNQVSWLVFDTNLDSCRIQDKQWALFEKTINNLKNTKYLIILHHHLLWLVDDGPFQARLEDISNAPLGTCSFCLKVNNFYEELYPVLKEVQESGIQVICVGGDMGNRKIEFEHVTRDSIVFLGSGLRLHSKNKRTLVFHHQLDSQRLTWTFERLEDLPQKSSLSD